MTKINISSSLAGQYDVNAKGNDYHLLEGVAISNGTYGIYEVGGSKNNSFTIDGSVGGTWEGIRSYGIGTEIEIGEGGSVTSYAGVGLHGADGHIVNNGTITATGSYGVAMDSADAGVLENAGTISGKLAGVHLYNGSFTVKNTGTITDTQGRGVQIDDADAKIVVGSKGEIIGAAGIYADNDEGQRVTVVNNGTINGMSGASIYISDGKAEIVNKGKIDGHIQTGDGADHLVNNGSISDNIDLGDGRNVFTNAGTLTGNYYSGEGNDRIVNLGVASSIYAGGGKDLIDTRKGTSGTLHGEEGNDTYLVSSTATAVAEKEGEGTDVVTSSATYTLSENVENLTLTGKATINGTGNGEANRLTGNAGINQLNGLDGNDILSGGKGADYLSGGVDADTFVFSTGFGKDRVTDFEAGIDHLNLSHWKGMDSFAEVMSHAKDTGDDLVFQFGKDSLTLEGIDKADLHKADFQF